jgi:hypothetical protein
VVAGLLARGERVERVKYGVDEDVCNGDHACIRLSGCPTLGLKDNPDPLKIDPVATVLEGCVGCGLCGENAHAATLCPSFYRAEVVRNPRWGERLVDGLRRALAAARADLGRLRLVGAPDEVVAALVADGWPSIGSPMSATAQTQPSPISTATAI